MLGLLFGVGIANMAFVIPSQTLFQERTPAEMMGRVVSFRFAIVFGGMSIAMAVGGLLTSAFGPGPVIAAAGLISIVGRHRRAHGEGPARGMTDGSGGRGVAVGTLSAARGRAVEAGPRRGDRSPR